MATFVGSVYLRSPLKNKLKRQEECKKQEEEERVRQVIKAENKIGDDEDAY
mgnify:CR=1 FL=1